MSDQPTTTFTGNLTDDVELRYLPSGAPMAKFRMAVTPRYQDSQGAWKDGTTMFPEITVFGTMAENIAESLGKGQRVTAHVRINQSHWETPEGEKRHAWKFEAIAVGADLKWATSKTSKMSRASVGGAPTGGGAEDPWATATPERPTR